MKTKEILALVYPEGILKRYVKFYDEFITNHLLPIKDELRLILIAPCREAMDSILAKFSGAGIEAVLIPDAVDIWVRDWAPIPAHFANGSTIYLKPDFQTTYYGGRLQSYIPRLKRASEKLAEYLDIKTVELPLKTDGGNFAFDGVNTVIVTKQILENNPDISKEEIAVIFKKSLGISKVIFIPSERFDTTGHTDGMLRFIDENTVIVGSYSSKFGVDRRFMTNIAEYVKENIGSHLDVIRLENHDMMDDSPFSNVSTASGNHINFLKTGRHIFIPDYGIPSSDESFCTLVRNLPGYTIKKVTHKSIFQISSDGGALNCITWN